MEIHTYSFITKVFYRFGNIFITTLMILNLFPLVANVDKNMVLILPILITLLIIYYTNRFYFLIYKSFPFRIEADEEKIVCTDFIFRNKEVVIYYNNIKSISGGIFEGRLSGIMKVCDGEKNICITFSHRIKNSIKLIATILSKVDKKIYDEKIESLQKISSKIRKK